jgi:hypothetical protein
MVMHLILVSAPLVMKNSLWPSFSSASMRWCPLMSVPSWLVRPSSSPASFTIVGVIWPRWFQRRRDGAQSVQHCAGPGVPIAGQRIHAKATENHDRRNAESGPTLLIVFCGDYHCAHSVVIDASRGADHVRLSDLEPRFTCRACGHRGAAERWNWRSDSTQAAIQVQQSYGPEDSFDEARAAFERNWAIFLARRTEDDFQAWRDQQAWTHEKYRRFDRGERMPHDWKPAGARRVLPIIAPWLLSNLAHS